MKQKKIKTQRYESNDTKEIKSLIIITLVIVVLGVGIYFLTDKFMNKAGAENTTPAEFNYSIATVGTMFNRPYSEYYVFLFDEESDNSVSYHTLISNYISKEKALKIYTVDLGKNLDNKYLSETSNKKPATPSEVRVKDSALVHIKDGKVVNYYETTEQYEKVLK